MRIFNILINDKNKIYKLEDIENINIKLNNLKSMVVDKSYVDNIRPMLETIYRLFPIYIGSDSIRHSFFEQLINITKNDDIYSNVSGRMFLDDLYANIYTERISNFDKYLYILDTINDEQLQPTDLNKPLIFNFENHNRYLPCHSVVNILISKIGIAQLVNAITLFYNLPVKKV